MHIEIIDEPLAARVHRLASPGFTVEPPALHDAALMAAPLAGALRSVWDRGSFAVRPIDFYRLRDVFVSGEGLVFDGLGRLYRSTIAQHSRQRIEAAARAIQKARGVPVHSGPVVLCKKIGSNNYGHWLLEMWPRAALAQTHLALPGLRYAIHAHDGAMYHVMRECLMLGGITPFQTIRAPVEPQFFEDLYLIDGLTEHGQYMSPLAVSSLSPLIARIPQGHAERLYVTRRSAEWRRLRNEAAMIRIAEQAGYVVIDPGGIGVVQQIGMFKGARRAVGIAGAAMTNTAFMPLGGQVDLFVPATMADNFFWFISQIRRHRHAEYRRPEIDPEAARLAYGETWNADLDLSRDAFRRILES